ncbi:hypothetical protein B0H10DRAFT_2214468 [Mycena sp. CBHHK59/15]|nr:hypothetical protein B0H10DRAFT_2214468 [Mycena sp. CBHHK59/15]
MHLASAMLDARRDVLAAGGAAGPAAAAGRFAPKSGRVGGGWGGRRACDTAAGPCAGGQSRISLCVSPSGNHVRELGAPSLTLLARRLRRVGGVVGNACDLAGSSRTSLGSALRDLSSSDHPRSPALPVTLCHSSPSSRPRPFSLRRHASTLISPSPRVVLGGSSTPSAPFSSRTSASSRGRHAALLKAFDINSNVGAACGEIVALKGEHGLYAFRREKDGDDGGGGFTARRGRVGSALHVSSPIAFAIVPRPDGLSSSALTTGFETSAYIASSIALQNDVRGERPLRKYFLGEKLLNGSFFAVVHSTVHFHYIDGSSHILLRKFWIHIEIFYQFFNLIFASFALANSYVACTILTPALQDPNFNLRAWRRTRGSKWGYTPAFLGFATITMYMTISAFLLAYKDIQVPAQEKGSALTVSNFFAYTIFRDIVVFVARDLRALRRSFLDLLRAMAYDHVLRPVPPHGALFTNVHDVSWGIKGDNEVSTDLDTVTTGKGDKKNEVKVVGRRRRLSALLLLPLVRVFLVDLSGRLLTESRLFAFSPPGIAGADIFSCPPVSDCPPPSALGSFLGAVVATASGKGSSDVGASKAVNGYMSFLLFFVAGLACAFFLCRLVI